MLAEGRQPDISFTAGAETYTRCAHYIGFVQHLFEEPPGTCSVGCFQPDVRSVHTAVDFQPGRFKALLHGPGIVHIIIYRFLYPVYIDSNVMCGRAGVLEGNGQWSNVTYMPCTAENDFIPEIPDKRIDIVYIDRINRVGHAYTVVVAENVTDVSRVALCSVENDFIPEIPDKRIDIVYLCYPNNPTGTTLTKPELKKWVDYALANDTLILFDAAYEAFIREDDVPHSIYEIKGAKKCAIEFRSFSKTAGFTGVRCGYTVVPKELTAATLEGERIPLNKLWNRRQSTKFNGTSYITQRAAEAIYTPEGQRQ